jgi:hypothetical protein
MIYLKAMDKGWKKTIAALLKLQKMIANNNEWKGIHTVLQYMFSFLILQALGPLQYSFYMGGFRNIPQLSFHLFIIHCSFSPVYRHSSCHDQQSVSNRSLHKQHITDKPHHNITTTLPRRYCTLQCRMQISRRHLRPIQKHGQSDEHLLP